MLKKIGLAAAILLSTMINSATAQDGPIVVELFTSQGCSSCPPADKMLGQLANREDIIALALHVDYWDYIGWKDEFASPAFTERQRAYARAPASPSRSIFTPQLVVGGQDHVIGARPMQLNEALMKHAAASQPVQVRLSRNGGRVSIQASSSKGLSNAVVQLVTYLPEARVAIERGENAGRTLTYHNVVRDWVEIGRWDGRGTFKANARVSAGTPVVVLVQEDKNGRMLGAARLR